MTKPAEMISSMCSGKDAFTPEQARKIALKMRKKKRAHITAYRCLCCGEWHVGNRPKIRKEK